MTASQPAPVDSLEVRSRLVEAVKLDLVGPWAGHELGAEQLPGRERPSNWYVAGFLIPTGTPPDRSGDVDENDDLDTVPESAGLAEESNDERKAARKAYFPSSIGLSFLVAGACRELAVTTRWGDYAPADIEEADGSKTSVWRRAPREAALSIPLGSAEPVVRDVPGSEGLQLHVAERPIDTVGLSGAHLPAGTRSVSCFLINRRTPDEAQPDRAYAFQAEIELRTDRGFMPRPDLRGAHGAEWDDRVADLHYAETPEYATGHGVSAEWELVDGGCRSIRTAWIGTAEVEKTATAAVPGVELSMETLGRLGDATATQQALGPLVAQYREWIEARRQDVVAGPWQGDRRDTAEQLLHYAGIAAERMAGGVALLGEDADLLEAFRVANRAVARALRQRLGEKVGPDGPRWRPFQLAFLLLNLPGLADRHDVHRQFRTLPERPPEVGELVQVRSGRWLVEEVTQSEIPSASALVTLACADDDAQGQALRVFWDYEIDRRILEEEGWANLAERGFDDARQFAAFLHTLRWHCVTATDAHLFQAPFRAGIRIDAYQMEPLRKALRLPRVNLFIADDTGLGKTIEAGLIARELLLRRKAKSIVVAAPPSVLEQWKGELEDRFSLVFEILDRAYLARMRRERGFGVNPWLTHSRFLVSHNLLVDPSYGDPMRAWLGAMRPGSLLILDEAHHAAPSSGGRYGIESKFTRAVRDLAGRFEHRLFLSATPHNGHSNSFSTLLELLDPYRFTRGVKVRGRKTLEDVMVRRLKEDIRTTQGGFPERRVERVVIDGLPSDAPELELSRLLDEYRTAREERHANTSSKAQAAAGLLGAFPISRNSV